MVWSLIAGLILIRCSDGSEPVPESFGRITLHFEQLLDGAAVEFDQMNYTNAAGNRYEVSEIQWFVSDVTLHGSVSTILDNDFAHYIDTDLPGTHEWALTDSISLGDYESISLVFGIKGEKNIPQRFPNPPESDMLWPHYMGGDQGGYHYMKLNGFWLDSNGVRQPFNFHLGVGKEVDGNGMEQYVQNWFEFDLDGPFSISANERKVITIEMNIENWFQDPHQYDHNIFGSRIMDNQAAMRIGCENGQNDVFTLGSIRSEFGNF